MASGQTTEIRPPSPQTVERGYEAITVNNRVLVYCLIGLFISAIVIHIGGWYFEKYLDARPRKADAAVSAIPLKNQFPPPDVQPVQAHNLLPRQDMDALRQRDEAVFKQMGWKIEITHPGAAPMIPDAIVQQLAARYAHRAAAQSAATRPMNPSSGGAP